MHQKITRCNITEMSTQIVHELVFLAGIVVTGNTFSSRCEITEGSELKYPFCHCAISTRTFIILQLHHSSWGKPEGPLKVINFINVTI
jgi:hypothetical protein